MFFRGTKYLMALVLPSVVALLVLAKPIITAWLGPDFAHMALSAQILLSYQLLWVGPVIGEHILDRPGTGRSGDCSTASSWSQLGNLVLSIVLVQRLGVLGVVIGTAVPWVVDFPSRMHVILSGVGARSGGGSDNSAGPVYLSLTATLAVAAAGYLTPLVAVLPGLLLLAGALSNGVMGLAAAACIDSRREGRNSGASYTKCSHDRQPSVARHRQALMAWRRTVAIRELMHSTRVHAPCRTLVCRFG